MRDSPWKRDELILALDLYMNIRQTPLVSDPDVIELSKTLRTLPIFPASERSDKFRNPNSVGMKCGNFQYLDPEVEGGLPAGSKLGEEIWNEFWGKRDELRVVAEKIREIAEDASLSHNLEDVVGSNEAEEMEAKEGETLYRLHRYKERNSAISKEKKRRALDKFGKLECEICQFNFHEKYGELGAGFIECHHTKPLAELQPNEKTKLSDLVLVCSNCHRMIHRKGLKSIEDIKDLYIDTKAK